MPCSAHYFDGQRATPHHGTLEVDDQQLLFTSPSTGTIAVPIRSLAPARHLGREVILECRSTDPAVPAPYWTLSTADFESALQPRLVQVRPAYGRRIPLKVWVALCVVLLPTAFLVTMHVAELGHLLVPVEKELEMGESLFQSISRHAIPCTDAGISNALNLMVQELRDPDSPYTPIISVWHDESANAFALPGGHIVVFTGLLPVAGGTDGIAGVLAHELAHIEKRHSLKQIMRSVGLMSFSSAVIGGSIEGLDALEQAAEMSSMLALLSYSRDAEHEADLVAVEKLHSRGYTVAGMETFFINLEKEERSSRRLDSGLAWLSSHPGTADRQAFIAAERKKETFDPKKWTIPAVNWTNVPPPTNSLNSRMLTW